MKFFLSFVVFVTCSLGCKPKFDPNLEFTPTDIIYGAISSDNKLNRFYVYSGFDADYFDENGKVKDSSSIYHKDSIELTITEFDYDDEQLRSYFIKSYSDDYLVSDVFDFNYNKYFQFDSSEFKITDGYYYKLRLENLKTQKVSYSKIQTISEFSIEKSEAGYNPGSLYGKQGFKNRKAILESIWDKEFYSKIEMHLIVETREIWQLGGRIIERDTLVFPIIKKSHSGFSLPTRFTYFLDAENFFNFLKENLNPIESNDYWRRFELVSYHIENYSKEMKEYIEAENGYNSLAQYKPIYSNVINEETNTPEAGVFYSHKSFDYLFSFDDSTMAFLDTSATYKNLGF